MKKILISAGFFGILTLLVPAFANAAAPVVQIYDIPDMSAESPALHLNVRRIGLELLINDVSNQAKYADSPIQQLSSSSSEFIKGIFDTVLAYSHENFTWNNSLFMEYGRTTLKPYNAAKTVNESADIILFSSDYSQKLWHFNNMWLGPIARAQYQTEFVKNGDIPRQNIARANLGFSLFDHPIIKELYLTGLYEYDFTYSPIDLSKLAGEFGWRLEYGLRPGVKISTNGYYREYFYWSEYMGTDLVRDLNAIVRMDVTMWNKLNVGPYVQYRRAKSREADVYGGNFVIGLSFSYINDFKLK